MLTKIIELDQAISNYKGCVLAYGHFTTIHPGHIRYLRHARDQGDKLVVALLADGNDFEVPKYAFTQEERAEALRLLSIADAILLMRDYGLIKLINKLVPELLVLGKEFENTNEKEIISAINLQRENGYEVNFHAGDIQYASTDLLKGSESELYIYRRKLFLDACKRQSLDCDILIDSIDSWKNANLLVIGDTIVDQYALCEAVGLSAEAPVVVVRELEKKNFIGGAAIVASHIRSLGAKCSFLSVIGNDNTGKIVINELKNRDIDFGYVYDNSRPTTFKKRYVVENQKLFRVSRLEDHKLDSNIEEQIIEKLRAICTNIDGIIVSDFVYGVLTDNILEEINMLVKKHKIMLFGDLQCSSQVGDITRFKNFSLLCPNERESRLSLRDNESGLEKLSQKLIKISKTERLVMKLGADGFIAYDIKTSDERKTQAFPALSVNPVDVAGAGDSLLSVMATGLSSGQSMMATSAIATCMASIAVETMGNLPISEKILKTKLRELFNF